MLEYAGTARFVNRFGIRPGAAWDGVDRSNGWEAKCFKRQNAAKVNNSARDAWAMADM